MDNQKISKNTFQAATFKDVSRTSPGIHGLFNPVIGFTPALTYFFFYYTTCLQGRQGNPSTHTGFIHKIEPFSKDFSRTTLDFQGPPTRNIILQIVQKCTFPVYSNKTLRLEQFPSPASLHFSVHLS